jgi:molecular chaperone GrpE (heat shock protein)
VSEFGEETGAGPTEVPDPAETLERVNKAQEALRMDFAELLQGFERLAGNLAPLLTKQYSDTQTRMRVLETRIRNRQERPLITRMANLLADVRRLESADDVKAHVEQAIVEALQGLGYQEMGSPGDQFDPVWHEPVSGSVGKAGIVTRVRRRGLSCYGDVIIKAMVDVEPTPEAEDAELAAARHAEDALIAETQQGGLAT